MTETTEGERAGALGEPRIHDLDFLTRLIHDADRLAQYERDLHDDIGEDRSQDTDWLRAGFLQRGGEIERLEDGIRALAESLDNDELRLPTGSGTYRQGVDNGYNLASQHAARKIYALLDGE